jgi:signal transduction histidine kinase
MHLADFIIQRMDTILAEWESFAGTCQIRGEKMSPLALRDNAKEILESIATDLRTVQSKDAQAQKSMGRAPVVPHSPVTAAQTHAVLRAKSGFDVKQLVSEYRALRATVSRLWLDSVHPESAETQDLVRFHEAIDQAVAESVDFFDEQMEQARDLLLGTLGHDLCSPLQAIKMTAAYLQEIKAGPEVSRAASLLDRSADSIQGLFTNLVDFSRTRLGLGISIDCKNVDLESLIRDEISKIRRIHPDEPIELQSSGNLRGYWDDHRLRQLFCKLVANAIRYGEKGKPVRIVVDGEEPEVAIKVSNHGPMIEPSALERIFEPLERLSHETSPCDGSLGLGLFLAREIVIAHGGSISAKSVPTETVFSVSLPRQTANMAS